MGYFFAPLIYPSQLARDFSIIWDDVYGTIHGDPFLLDYDESFHDPEWRRA